MRIAAAATLFTLLATMAGAHAADLDAQLPVADLPPEPPLVAPPPVVDRGAAVEQVVPGPPPPPALDEVLTPRRPGPVFGGPAIFVPGLNGPSGPPVYPLLPFSFGYGY